MSAQPVQSSESTGLDETTPTSYGNSCIDRAQKNSMGKKT